MIRFATTADAEAIVRIYNHYVTETAITFELEPVSAEAMAQRIRTIQANYPWYVWEEDGAVLGYAYAGKFKEREAYRFAAETTVYVAPDQGRRGIGAALYQELIPELRRRGFHAALAIITLPNEASVGLHERFGFRKAGHMPEVGWKLERWLDVGYWALLL